MVPDTKKLRITKAAKKRGQQATEKMNKVRIKALRAHKVNAQTLKEIEKKEVDRPLSERQLIFVRLWAQGETPRTAASLAGYSESSTGLAWKLTRDPAIIKLYQAEKKLYEEAGQMTRKRVMDMLQEAYDCAKLMSEPASMVAAAREIGKMCGYYEPETKININIGGKLVEKLASMTDDQLLEVMASEGALEGVFERIADPSNALPPPNGSDKG